MFLAAYLSHGVLYSFIFVRKGYFSPTRSVSINMQRAIFTLNYFRESKLAKTLLIFLK